MLKVKIFLDGEPQTKFVCVPENLYDDIEAVKKYCFDNGSLHGFKYNSKLFYDIKIK